MKGDSKRVRTGIVTVKMLQKIKNKAKKGIVTLLMAAMPLVYAPSLARAQGNTPNRRGVDRISRLERLIDGNEDSISVGYTTFPVEFSADLGEESFSLLNKSITRYAVFHKAFGFGHADFFLDGSYSESDIRGGMYMLGGQHLRWTEESNIFTQHIQNMSVQGSFDIKLGRFGIIPLCKYEEVNYTQELDEDVPLPNPLMPLDENFPRTFEDDYALTTTGAGIYVWFDKEKYAFRSTIYYLPRFLDGGYIGGDYGFDLLVRDKTGDDDIEGIGRLKIIFSDNKVINRRVYDQLDVELDIASIHAPSIESNEYDNMDFKIGLILDFYEKTSGEFYFALGMKGRENKAVMGSMIKIIPFSNRQTPNIGHLGIGIGLRGGAGKLSAFADGAVYFPMWNLAGMSYEAQTTGESNEKFFEHYSPTDNDYSMLAVFNVGIKLEL